MSLSDTARADSLVTFIFSLLSLLGSVLVLIAYLVARSKSTPRIANLILHLAASDFFWFLSAGIQSGYWLFSSNNEVPTNACFFLSPLMSFTRMASLAWTCVISFNVLMSVEKRKWLWQGGDESWTKYHQRYYIAIFLLAAPGTVLTLVKQHTSKDTSDLGCSPNYEALGLWYEVFFPEVLPILMGFICNVYVFLNVYGKVSKTAYPQSVRKRRKRIMYHYIIVCIICWVPTVLNYMIELIGYHSTEVEIIARACLYSSGFLNFLVFGMQDPHLKRSIKLILHYSGISAVCLFCLPTSSFLYYYSPLKGTDVEKNVMFQEETILSNADIAKDKRSVYRNRKLSKSDRLSLYAERPDLDLRSPPQSETTSNAFVPAKSAMKGSRAASQLGNNNNNNKNSVYSPLQQQQQGLGDVAVVSCEEEAASLFHNQVASGSIRVTASSPALIALSKEIDGEQGNSGNNNGRSDVGDSIAAMPLSADDGMRARSGSRTRSSSFHSGVCDGKYDILAPLLINEEKHRPLPPSTSTTSASYPVGAQYTLNHHLDAKGTINSNNNTSTVLFSKHNTPYSMDVVSAGFRTSSTERLVVPHNSIAGDHDEHDILERGGSGSLGVNGKNVKSDKECEVRRQLESDLDDDEPSSSDDESDEEDKELSIPIS
mmetsp:Transcript_129263/g.253137  ORF Transcript_129263/g.253137 Transcript_129263/m.253137 type:complete len:656 (-) Transcript_129263:189-2156(-)